MPKIVLVLFALLAGHAVAQVTPAPSPSTVASPQLVAPQPSSPVSASSRTSTPQASAAPLPPLDAGLETAERILKVLAYLVGGVWVYYNYFQGRTHQSRLEVKVSGTRLGAATPNLAKVSTLVKNVGLSKTELLDGGSAIRLYGYDATKSVDQWTLIETYDSLVKNNQWIEPGVSVEEHILIPIDPGIFAAFRVDLILNSKKVRWKTTAIF